MLVLICAQENDLHVSSVSHCIETGGGKPILFERYRKDHFISYFYSHGECKVFLNIEGNRYDLINDFCSIWWRIKPTVSSELPSSNGEVKEQFCVNEWRNALYSLSFFMNKKKWINPLLAVHQINKKPFQLMLASQCGLSIPETVITNDIETLSSFMNFNNRVIYKTLSSFFSDEFAIYTTEVDKNNILDDVDAISIAPSIFQTLIEKKHELRVTIVGNEVFTAKVDSQKTRESQIDWRHGNYNEMFSKGYLSKDTTLKLLDFHKKAGLIYAAYDFIVDKDGNEIFLECNPSGQWLWLEDKSELDISKAIATELLCI